MAPQLHPEDPGAAWGEAEIERARLKTPWHRRRGKTALHEAAFWGREGVVNFLLANGADKTLRDAVHRRVAEGWAEAGGHPNLARRIRQTPSSARRDELWEARELLY